VCWSDAYIAVNNGEEAVREFTANRNKISLVVLDVAMPLKDRTEAYLQMREILSDLSAITTGHTTESVLLSSLVKKGAAFLQKSPCPVGYRSGGSELARPLAIGLANGFGIAIRARKKLVLRLDTHHCSGGSPSLESAWCGAETRSGNGKKIERGRPIHVNGMQCGVGLIMVSVPLAGCKRMWGM
jgi:CheY-like chemotaxis protein